MSAAPGPATVILESGLTAVEPPFGWNPPPRDPYGVVPRKIEHNNYENELLYRYRDSTYGGRSATAGERVPPNRQRGPRVFRAEHGVQATHLTVYKRIPGSNEFIEVPAGSKTAVDAFMGISRPPQTPKRSTAAARGIGPSALDADYMTQLVKQRYGNAIASGNLSSLDLPRVRDFAGAGFSARRPSQPRLGHLLQVASARQRSSPTPTDNAFAGFGVDGLAVSGTQAVLHRAVERSQKIDGVVNEQPPLGPNAAPAWRPPGIAQPPSHQPASSLRTFHMRSKSSLGFVPLTITSSTRNVNARAALLTQGFAAATGYSASPMVSLLGTEEQALNARTAPLTQRERPRPKSAAGFFTTRVEAAEERPPVQELGRSTPGLVRFAAPAAAGQNQSEMNTASANERAMRTRPARPSTACAVRPTEKADTTTAPSSGLRESSGQVLDQAAESAPLSDGQAMNGTKSKAVRPKTAPATRSSTQFESAAHEGNGQGAMKPPSTYELELEYGGTVRVSGTEPVMRPVPIPVPSDAHPLAAALVDDFAGPVSKQAVHPANGRVRPKSAAPALLGANMAAQETLPPPPSSPMATSGSGSVSVGVSVGQDDGAQHTTRWSGRRAQSAMSGPTATSTDARGRQRAVVPVTTITFPSSELSSTGRDRERPPRNYDEALRRYGWRMEVHNDPLNLKKQFLHPRYEYTVELNAPDAMPPAPGLTAENRDTFFYNTIPTTKLGEFTIAPDFASERFCEQRERLRRTGKWKYNDKSFSFLY